MIIKKTENVAFFCLDLMDWWALSSTLVDVLALLFVLSVGETAFISDLSLFIVTRHNMFAVT